ncbi:MAG TPA: flagellar export protein FliJ [Deltaproteobacteria bacterium]|jgi:flagellar export protein FliJ|nr:flagellar export protein FliJ [Deltaproteobacteria bacterium]HQI01532.1 flagellar export protein FliJ [Deltaproteobacteria bacterium]HQJ08181.1 flagellar export protein FliJ [Deltaproteobacteria bacterium]
MGFHFRFETLSRVRKIREDMALGEFSKAQKHCLELEAIRQRAISLKAASERELMGKMDRGIEAREVKSYGRYLSYLDSEAAKLEKQIVQARKVLEEKRRDLLKAQKDSKAIERLREIDLDRYKADQARKDMRFIDEIAIGRHGRRP